MHGRRTALLAAFTLAVGGCAAAPATTTTSPMATPSPTPVASRPSAMPPPSTPLPTLVSTTEVASNAPDGAILVIMTATGDAEHPKLAFKPADLTAAAGTVVFFLENVPPVWASPDHDMRIGPAFGMVIAASSVVDRNEKAVFTVNSLAPGEYVFWCAVLAPDGRSHASHGMIGTLTITP